MENRRRGPSDAKREWASRWRQMVSAVSATTHPLDDSLIATVWTAVGGDSADGHAKRAVLLTLRRLMQSTPASAARHGNMLAVERLLKNFLVPASTAASRLDPQDAAFQNWVAAHLGEQTTVQLCHFEGTGRGLASACDVAAGDAVIQVPPALLLTAHSLHPRAASLLANAARAAEAEELLEEMALCLALLIEVEGCGAWAQYAQILPKRPPSALYWPSARLAAVSATPIAVETRATRAALRRTHLQLAPALRHELPQLLPAAACRWCRFLWAYAIVESRGVALEATTKWPRRTALVPLADMLNHSVRAQLAWPNIEADGSLVFRALVPVHAGDQILLYYGRLSARQTLQHYGFMEGGQLLYEATWQEEEDDEEEEGEEEEEEEEVGEEPAASGGPGPSEGEPCPR